MTSSDSEEEKKMMKFDVKCEMENCRPTHLPSQFNYRPLLVTKKPDFIILCPYLVNTSTSLYAVKVRRHTP